MKKLCIIVDGKIVLHEDTTVQMRSLPHEMLKARSKYLGAVHEVILTGEDGTILATIKMEVK